MTEFDVFLCHNSQDKPEVIEIALQLQQRGLKPWLDAWELPPGQSWQELLEEQIEQVKSAAVFVGSSGLGPWQKREMRAFLSEFVDRGCPVIPVLLEQAPQKPKLPIFLKALTWVDFRHSESNPLGRLIWGITGIRPADFDTRLKAQAQSFTENLGNGIKLEMIAIPGGKFLMGTEDQEIERLVEEYGWDGFKREKPQHQVTVPSFALGKYPITQAQYQQVMSKNPSYFQGDDRPVEQVNWDEAVEFCNQLSTQTGKVYRLPTEAEWEYACRAGTTTAYYFGENITKELANYKGSETTAVGQFPPNAFGLYDMHGNVWEWCQDDWHDSYQNAPDDGSAWGLGDYIIKVIRGGSWLTAPVDCRSATRGDISRALRNTIIGFRVVCVVPWTT